MTEMECVKAAALLCEKWIKLGKEIDRRRDMLKPVPDAKAVLTKEAEEYADKKEKSVGFFITTLLQSVLLFFVIPAAPIALLLAALLLGVDLSFMEEYGWVLGLLVVGLAAVGGVVGNYLQKNRRKLVIEQYIRKNQDEYLKKTENIRRENEDIQNTIHNLSKKKAALENEMRDRSVCCIHPDYWYAGPQLYYLMDCDRADTLKEAIQEYEKIKEIERRRLAEEAAAEAARWGKIEDMLGEHERNEKRKRLIREILRDI